MENPLLPQQVFLLILPAVSPLTIQVGGLQLFQVTNPLANPLINLRINRRAYQQKSRLANLRINLHASLLATLQDSPQMCHPQIHQDCLQGSPRSNHLVDPPQNHLANRLANRLLIHLQCHQTNHHLLRQGSRRDDRQSNHPDNHQVSPVVYLLHNLHLVLLISHLDSHQKSLPDNQAQRHPFSLRPYQLISLFQCRHLSHHCNRQLFRQGNHLVNHLDQLDNQLVTQLGNQLGNHQSNLLHVRRPNQVISLHHNLVLYPAVNPRVSLLANHQASLLANHQANRQASRQANRQQSLHWNQQINLPNLHPLRLQVPLQLILLEHQRAYQPCFRAHFQVTNQVVNLQSDLVKGP